MNTYALWDLMAGLGLKKKEVLDPIRKKASGFGYNPSGKASSMFRSVLAMSPDQRKNMTLSGPQGVVEELISSGAFQDLLRADNARGGLAVGPGAGRTLGGATGPGVGRFTNPKVQERWDRGAEERAAREEEEQQLLADYYDDMELKRAGRMN